MELSIAAAQQDDADQVCAVDRRVLGSATRQEWLRRKIVAGRCIVACAAGHLVGFAVSDRSFFEQPFLELLIVEPAARRQGVASALVRCVEATWAPRRLFTSTNTSNAPMRHLLESLGYARSGVVENLDDGDPERIYFKHLTWSSMVSRAATAWLEGFNVVTCSNSVCSESATCCGTNCGADCSLTLLDSFN